jgi:hypothetical protein
VHPHYEDAAHAALFMARAGLDLVGCQNAMGILTRLAEMLDHARSEPGLSHAGAAAWMLDDLEKRKLVFCPSDKRKKVIAVLGTYIGNLCLQRRR